MSPYASHFHFRISNSRYRFSRATEDVAERGPVSLESAEQLLAHPGDHYVLR